MTVDELRDALAEARFPKTFAVSQETYDAVENYLHKQQVASIAEWKAAGEPETWDKPLWFLFAGREHFGVMFKNVELYVPA